MFLIYTSFVRSWLLDMYFNIVMFRYNVDYVSFLSYRIQEFSPRVILFLFSACNIWRKIKDSRNKWSFFSTRFVVITKGKGSFNNGKSWRCIWRKDFSPIQSFKNNKKLKASINHIKDTEGWRIHVFGP